MKGRKFLHVHVFNDRQEIVKPLVKLFFPLISETFVSFDSVIQTWS